MSEPVVLGNYEYTQDKDCIYVAERKLDSEFPFKRAGVMAIDCSDLESLKREMQRRLNLLPDDSMTFLEIFQIARRDGMAHDLADRFLDRMIAALDGSQRDEDIER